MSGEYKDPVGIIAFNTAERWSEDVSEDIPGETRRRFDLQMADCGPLPAGRDGVTPSEARRGLRLLGRRLLHWP